jgi:hypothetical protein
MIGGAVLRSNGVCNRVKECRRDTLSAMEKGFGIGVMIAFWIVVVVIMLIFHQSRADSLLQGFLVRNGFRLIEKQRVWFFRGPFFFTTGKGQEVYYVTVQDRHGSIRSRYVRCGGWILGMFSNNVEVRWDRA